MAARDNTGSLGIPVWMLERFSSHGIRVAVSEKGRGLVADREFEAGTVLLRSNPFSSAIAGKHICVFCNKCGQKKELKRCSKCNFVRYCSRECQANAWPDHKRECGFINSKIAIFTELQLNSLLLLRTLEMNEVEKIKQGVKDRELCPELGMLESHREKFLSLELRGTKNTTFDIILKTYKPFLADRAYTVSEDTLFDIHCKLAVNANAFQSDSGETISSGLFPEQTLLNHSCRPNCLNCFRGLEVLLVASRNIHCGEELTINYIDLIKPVWERKRMLEEKSHFTCGCDRCVEESELPDTNEPKWLLMDRIYEGHMKENWKDVLSLSSQVVNLEFTDLKCDVIEILVLRLIFEAYTALKEDIKALKTIKQLIEISKKFLPIYSHELSTHYVRLAELMAQLSQHEEAREVIQTVTRPIEIVYGKEHLWYKQLMHINSNLT